MRYLKDMGLDPTTKDKYFQTCLYYTCREGKVHCCAFLIDECGLNVNEKDIYGQNPIYYAVSKGKLDVVKLMIEKKSDINLEDNFGQTCIFYCIKNGYYEVTEYLIKHGANVNKVDPKGMTPYTFAEKFEQTAIANLLLANGANKPEKRNERKNEKPKTKIKTKNIMHHQSQLSSSSSMYNTNNNSNNNEDIQKPRKFMLVKIKEDGTKVPLNEDEIEFLRKNHSDIFKYLDNKDERRELCDNAPKDLVYYDNWETQAKKLMKSLWKLKESELFHEPVDIKKYNIPDYYDIIKHPMDFRTIKNKLDKLMYSNFKEFCSDIDLTFNNCFMYNGEESDCGKVCANVKNEYYKLYNQMGMQKFL